MPLSIVEFVEGSNSGGANTDDETWTLSAAPQEGDLIVAIVKHTGYDSLSDYLNVIPGFTGWIEPAVFNYSVAYCYKVAGPSEGTTYTATSTGITHGTTGGMYVLRGADTADLFGTAATQTTATSWVEPETVAFTASEGGVALVGMGGLISSTADMTPSAPFTKDGTSYRAIWCSATDLTAGADTFEISDGQAGAQNITSRAILVLPVNAGASGPTLTSGTVTNETTDGFTLGYSTDTANGTAYYVVYPTGSTAPSAAQIQAGTDGDDVAAVASGNQAVSATGADTFPAITGLAPGAYAYSIVHRDTTPEDSNILTGTNDIITVVTEPLYFGASLLADKTGISWKITQGHTDLIGTVLDSGAANGTTNGAGELVLPVSTLAGATNDLATLFLYWTEGDPVVDRSLIVRTTIDAG